MNLAMDDFEKLLPGSAGRPSRTRSYLRNIASIAALHLRKFVMAVVFFLLASTFWASKPVGPSHGIVYILMAHRLGKFG